MKVLFVLLTVLVFLASEPCALCGDLEMVAAANNGAEGAARADPNELMLKAELEIPGFAAITPVSFGFEDTIEVLWTSTLISGMEADYASLRIDILNVATEAADFVENATVKVVFAEKYEYQGWMRQYNYDESDSAVIQLEDQFPIKPLYEGHYVVGCTLPNAVVTDQAESLRLTITLAGHEMVYNIR